MEEEIGSEHESNLNSNLWILASKFKKILMNHNLPQTVTDHSKDVLALA